MIVLHPSAERLLRRLVDAGTEGLPADELPAGDSAGLVLDGLAEIKDRRLYVTGKGAAHSLRVVS